MGHWLTVQLQERNIEFAERRLEGIRIRAQKPNENIAPRRNNLPLDTDISSC